MKLTRAETSLIIRKWNALIEETRAAIKKAKGEDYWENEFHATRVRRFVERHVKGNENEKELIEKNLMYLVCYTRLHKPNIRDVSLDLLSLNKDGQAQCLFCEEEPMICYCYEPHPNNTQGRDVAFLFWVCNDHETKVQEYNILITQMVDGLYSKNRY